jgi:hypothetical protein
MFISSVLTFESFGISGALFVKIASSMPILSFENRHHRRLPVNDLFGKDGFFGTASFFSTLSCEYEARIGGLKAEYLRSQCKRMSLHISKVGNMDWDRHRYFTLGVVLFLLGIQFRMLDSFVLNETSTRALHRFAKQSQIATPDGMTDMYLSVAKSPKKTVKPPNWIGWILLTSGCVVSLHALAMPRRQ